MAPPGFSGNACPIEDSGKIAEIVQHKHARLMGTHIPWPDFNKLTQQNRSFRWMHRL
jgi:hypothetical protein